VSDFHQTPPRLGDPFGDDPVLTGYLARRLPAEIRAAIEPGLSRLADLAAGEMLALADEAERDPPRLVPFDAWGRRIDRIEVSPAWKRLHAIAAEEGVLATAYERREGAWSRVHQIAKLYLYHPSSAVASCPLAMADGAARVIELHGDAELRERVLPHLLSRDPATFWTSGQWMTERTGGSDVSGNSTVAVPDGSGFRLHGVKWFTSATTAEIALALARIEGAPEGSRGLSLFLIELGDGPPPERGIHVLRLKDKLGTRALPTAELELVGTPARLVGESGRGVATVASMLNVTRLYNATCAAASLGRALMLARDYATRRRAFGKLLAVQPLHLEMLADLAAEQAGAFHLVFLAAELVGREETGAASQNERAVLRLLVPLAKLSTGKQVVAGVSEALEAFGGAGYVEDTGLPRMLRDAQVLSIWEGTTNVLALDALRAIRRDGSHVALVARLAEVRDEIEDTETRRLAEQAFDRMRGAVAWLERAAAEGTDALEAGARRFALELARAASALLVAAQADFDLKTGRGPGMREAARRLLAPSGVAPEGTDREATRALALGAPDRFL
jgi:alkylation response protein AidB-like acyl-CoA dehydrogenase